MNLDEQHSNKKRTSGKRFEVPVDNISESSKQRKATTFIPDETEQLKEAPESITSGERLPHVAEYSGIKLEALPLKGLKSFIIGFGIVLVVFFIWEVVSVTISLLDFHWLLAGAFLSLVALVVLLAVRVIWNFFDDQENIDVLETIQKTSEHLSEINDLDEAAKFLEQLKAFYANKPQHNYLLRCLEKLPDYSNDREVIEHIERVFIRPLDNEAMRRVSHYSVQTCTIVAVSPWASLDMLLSLWRSVKMIEDIAQVYGIRPSIPNRFKLLKLVMHQLVFVAASDVVLDQLIEEFGASSLASLTGARIGQGLGAGIYAAKIGVAAIEVCRPIAFTSESRPKLKALLVLMFNKIKTIASK